MKKLLTIVIILIPSILKADVIYSPYSSNHLAVSFEWIFSYEFPFSKHNTIAPWGGLGVVSASNTSFNPSLGTEIGFEARHYFKDNTFDGFNIGLYGGLAYMLNYSISHAKIYHDFNSLGIVPGIKITYKHLNKKNNLFEPYLGVSNPFHKNLSTENTFENIGFMVTLGFRVGLNRIN